VNNGASKWNDQLGRVHSNFITNGARVLELLEGNNRQLQELLEPKDKLNIVKVTRKDIKWSKIFENIRQNASSLHAVLQNGWNCGCQSPHQGGLRLQKRDIGEASPHFNVTFVAPTEALNNVYREVIIKIKEEHRMQSVTHPAILQSLSVLESKLGSPSYHSASIIPYFQPTIMPFTTSPTALRSTLHNPFSIEFADQYTKKVGQPARRYTKMQSTTGTQCSEDVGRTR